MEIARHWRLNQQRYGLQGSICTCCGKPAFGPRVTCEACSRRESASESFKHSAIMQPEIEAVYIAQR